MPNHKPTRTSFHKNDSRLIGDNNPMRQPGVAAKQSKTMKRIWGQPEYKMKRSGKNHPMFGKKRPDASERMRKNNPMKQSKVRARVSESTSGERHHYYGKKRPEHGERMNGKNNPAYVDGCSREPYELEFNYQLKSEIRQRDNFSCQLCPAVENGRAFPNHHVDYDKKNNDKTNLLLLCQPCNNKANVDREKWQFLFETLMEIRIADL